MTDTSNQTAIPPDWTTERKLRSAVMMLQDACDAVLRLASLDDRLLALVVQALAYSRECQKR